jgi:predicted Zn-dependent protease
MINWKKFWTFGTRSDKSLGQRLSHIKTRHYWFYPLISILVAISVTVSVWLPATALDFNFLPLLLQGFQAVQLSSLSDSQEIQLGKQMNQQLSSQIKFYHNPEVDRYVQQIGSRLSANSTRPHIPYVFQVIDDNAINAFATTGGYIYVNKGLLKAADNEAQVAGVLGHEMGHIEAKHLLQQMRHQAIEKGILTAAGLSNSQAVSLGTNLAFNLPLSRKDEYEADKRGLRNLTRTGYSQTAMVAFMQKLLAKNSPPAFLSTHPGTGDRIKALDSQISAQPHSNSYGLDGVAYQNHVRSFLR